MELLYVVLAHVFAWIMQGGPSTAVLETRDYCYPEGFNVSCGNRDIIMMHKAFYGRMRTGTCLTSDYEVGCSSDVLLEMDRKCSGRHSCFVSVLDEALHPRPACPGDMFGYLEAAYTCIKVESGTGKPCRPAEGIPLTAPSGSLASITARERWGYQGAVCPWSITLSAGQRINVTLYDFGVATRTARRDSMCEVYATIHERALAVDITICSSGTREKAVYFSESNHIKIAMRTTTQPNPVNYVLKYEAVGCSDPEVPTGAWLSRNGDKAVITCNFTTQAWHIVCHGNTWFGRTDNCTTVSNGQLPEGQTSQVEDFPYGLLVAVIAGIVLGVLIGVALLSGVVICHRRRRRRMRRDERTGADELGVTDDMTEATQGGVPLFTGYKPVQPCQACLQQPGYYTHVCGVALNYQPYAHGQTRAPPSECGGMTELGTPCRLKCSGHDYEKPGYPLDIHHQRLSETGKFYQEFDCVGVDVLQQVATAAKQIDR